MSRGIFEINLVRSNAEAADNYQILGFSEDLLCELRL